MTYIAPTTHITPFATLRRDRMLPSTGEIIALPGQRVEASDVVARAFAGQEHRIVDYGHALGLPPEKADKLLVKRDGEPVKKGEPIAIAKGPLGLGKRVVASPVDGVMLVAGDGRALLAATDSVLELRAGLPGTIANVHPERGVTIETTGALIEGVWGNGQNSFAVMRVLGTGLQDVLVPDSIEMSLRGAILAVGQVQDPAALRKAAEVGLRGLIVGSLNAELLPAAEKLELPLIVTDGFGEQGFSAPVFAMLGANDQKEVALDARRWNRFTGARPEVIVFIPAPGQSPPPPTDGEALQVGKRVRIVRGAQAGQSGTLSALSEQAGVTGSGVRSRVAAVQLEGAAETPLVTIPFANLEILE